MVHSMHFVYYIPILSNRKEKYGEKLFLALTD